MFLGVSVCSFLLGDDRSRAVGDRSPSRWKFVFKSNRQLNNIGLGIKAPRHLSITCCHRLLNHAVTWIITLVGAFEVLRGCIIAPSQAASLRQRSLGG
jgi:hypothetical protein